MELLWSSTQSSKVEEVGCFRVVDEDVLEEGFRDGAEGVVVVLLDSFGIAMLCLDK